MEYGIQSIWKTSYQEYGVYGRHYIRVVQLPDLGGERHKLYVKYVARNMKFEMCPA